MTQNIMPYKYGAQICGQYYGVVGKWERKPFVILTLILVGEHILKMIGIGLIYSITQEF
jgi:hypothetical protein